MRHFPKFINLICFSLFTILGYVHNAIAESEDIEPKSGVYNEVQLVPNFFATYCGYNAEDLAENLENRKHCINTLGVFVNPNQAQIRLENRGDYGQNVVVEEARVIAALTTAKNASIPDLRQGVAELSQAATQTTTTHDDSKDHILALSKYKDTLNSLRELMAETNFNRVAKGINNIDKEIAISVARDESNIVDNSLEENGSGETSSGAEAGNENGAVSKGESTGDNGESNGSTQNGVSSVITEVTEYTPENPYKGKWMWVEGNRCSQAICTGKGDSEASLNCTYETDNCPDGAYTTNVANKIVSCKDGKCEVLSTRDEDICGDKSLVFITKLKFAYQSGDQPAVCTKDETFTLCTDGKYKIAGGFYYACRHGKCVECVD